MIKSFFRIALRNFARHFTYSAINVIGLAIGIASSLVILVYVFNELSYEKHFKDRESIYRIGTKFMTMGEFANGPLVLLNVLPEQYPWVEKTCRVNADDKVILKAGDFTTKESGLFVEPEFFNIFQYDFERGNGVLSDNGLVLNKTLADKLFTNENPIGKVIELTRDGKSLLYSVKGVIDTHLINSHLNAPFWAAAPPLENPDPNWFMINTYNYIKTSEGIGQVEVQSALDHIIRSQLFPLMESSLPFEVWYQRDDAYRLIAQPVSDIYLKGTLGFDLSQGGNAALVLSLAVIALLILVIAGINFINLSTARAVNRSKEVGLKKVIGSTRLQLALQFLSESILVSTLALILALGLAELLLIGVESITGLEIVTSVFSNPSNLIIAFMLSLALGLISGVYPALILSSFKPVDVLKVSFKGQSNVLFRNVLVVFQFGLSTILVIGTLVIFQQLQFMRSKDLGFNKENLLIVDNANLLKNSLTNFKETLANYPGVIQTCIVNRLPASSSSYSIANIESPYVEEPLKINRFRGDFDYPSTLGFQIVAGRFFDKQLASDSSAVLLNESAVKALMLPDPIGQVLNKKYEVIGVVKDFNFESLKHAIAPSMISVSKEGYQVAIRVQRSEAANVIDAVEKEWNLRSTEEPLRYHFLDENFANLMRNEKVMGEVLALFSVLAIFVACLGLFGLSAYLATQRRQEIGIRKVLGASVGSVLSMFGKEYSKLVLISFVIAIPASIYLMQKWLSDFAYRVEISWWIIGATCLLVLFIAWITVSYHSIKTSLVNPAETLRNE